MFCVPSGPTPPSHRTLRSSYLVKLRQLTIDHTPSLVDPLAVTLPFHSTPMDEVSGVRETPGMQYVIPVVGQLTHTAGQAPPTQAVESLH